MGKEDRLLIEYQKAQDSAEHHNVMIWTLISVLLGFSISIFYILLREDAKNLGEPISIVLLGVGSFALYYFSILVEGANEKKSLKYLICKQIEDKLKLLGQHRLTEEIQTTEQGIKILRTIRLVLLFLYMVFIGVSIFLINKKPPSLTKSILIIALIFISLASILFLIVDFVYLRKNKRTNNSLKEKELFNKSNKIFRFDRMRRSIRKFKKKHFILFIFLFLIWSILLFYAGNFLDNSYFVKSTNIFNKLLGQTVIEIDEYYNPIVNDGNTIIYFEIKNIGDKDIEDLQILYKFCGLKQQKANLEKLNLRIGDKQKFSITIPIKLNLSCSVFTDRVKLDVYEDTEKNCYLDIEDKISNVCKYCKIIFEVYGNNKRIPQEPIWYPYLDEPTNVGAMVRYLLVYNPITITWVEDYNSTCKVLYPNSLKKGLNKREPIHTTLIDTNTMCLRGDDIEWCKENYYRR